MVLNNYIDNHLTELEEKPLSKKEMEEFKQINAERELKDTFAHKMLRKFMPKTVKAIDSLKPSQLMK